MDAELVAGESHQGAVAVLFHVFEGVLVSRSGTPVHEPGDNRNDEADRKHHCPSD